MTVSFERHELDEAHLDVLLSPERGEVNNFVVVGAAFDHCVDFDRRETGFLRSLNAVQHIVEFVTTRHLEELLALKGVKADVDPLEPCSLELRSNKTHRGTVGGHRQIDRSVRTFQLGEHLDKDAKVGPNRGLATRKADPLHAIALDKDPGELLNLFERHDC